MLRNVLKVVNPQRTMRYVVMSLVALNAATIYFNVDWGKAREAKIRAVDERRVKG